MPVPLCVWQCSRAPCAAQGWGWAAIGPCLRSPHTHCHTQCHRHTFHHPATQPPLSRRQPHCHTLSHTQSCAATPSARNTACHTLSPRCRPQKYRHSLSDAGHTCLQPHRLTPGHTDPDALPPTLCQHHIDQQGRTCILGPGGCPCSCASHVATQSHCPARSQGGEANLITSAPGCGTQLPPEQCLNPTSYSNNSTTHPDCHGAGHQKVQATHFGIAYKYSYSHSPLPTAVGAWEQGG